MRSWIMAKPRLTPTQRDVLDRMRDGWALEGAYICSDGAYLRKPGEPQRHVAWNTCSSLFERAYITTSGDKPGCWVRNEYWIEKSGLLA